MNGKYNPNLTPFSKELRNNMTPEEKHLWYDCLKLLPYNIHRQKTIGTYIVDFYCASCKIVIEVDGAQHYEKDGIEKDMLRDNYLASLGLTVLRYSNYDIKTNFEGVCTSIEKALEKASP